MLKEHDFKLASELVEVIKFFAMKGWSPATSTNYSVKSSDQKKIIISKSGVDKSQFHIDDLILIDFKGNILSPFNQTNVKSSAETEIHTYLYEKFPEVSCVLHTHSALATVLSSVYANKAELSFQGLEILKGFKGNQTHELTETISIVPNSQNMNDIIKHIDSKLTHKSHGFLIAGHGLYSWGEDLASTKRHIETFEFLFECFDKLRSY